MDTFAHAEVKELLDRREGPCVSLFLPTHRTGEERKQDPIRLKNLLREAESRLIAGGLRSPAARELLAPAVQMLDDSLFWTHQSEGLAVFLAPRALHRYRLPLRLEELAVTAERFHLKPLFPMLIGNGRFYVLAVSQKSVVLWQGGRFGIDPVALEGVPRSLADVLRYDVFERQLQFHTRAPERGGKRAAMFHGQGPGEEQTKDQLLRYFHQIDAGLCDFLQGERVPLVLAGVEYYFPIYREANHYPHLLDGGVTGSPEGLRPEELHRQAWALVEPHARRQEEEALARYHQFAGTGRTANRLEEILPAAHQGRVETLFAARGVQRWGAYDPARNEVRFMEANSPGAEDLLDLATIQTYVNRGTAYVVEPARLPDDAPAAAIFRY
jgi:hypothetical protein